MIIIFFLKMIEINVFYTMKTSNIPSNNWNKCFFYIFLHKYLSLPSIYTSEISNNTVISYLFTTITRLFLISIIRYELTVLFHIKNIHINKWLTNDHHMTFSCILMYIIHENNEHHINIRNSDVNNWCNYIHHMTISCILLFINIRTKYTSKNKISSSNALWAAAVTVTVQLYSTNAARHQMCGWTRRCQGDLLQFHVVCIE